jgi:hypothetical protein
MVFPGLLALTLAVVLPQQPPLQPAPPPDAHTLILKLAAQDKVLQQHRKHFDCDLLITREKLDDDNKVTDTSTTKVLVQGDHRPDFGTRSGPAATTGSPEDESKKASQEEPFELLKIMDHYTYTVEGQEMVNGTLCYKIAFTPKPDQPYDNREEKVLNNVSGHLWISTGNYSLVANEGSLQRPVQVAWIFASLVEMHFRFDAQLMPNGDYAPRREEYSYRVNIPFFTLHERDTRDFSNFRPINASAQ